LRAGDASQLETSAARVGRLRAGEELARASSEEGLARLRLKSLVGLGAADQAFELKVSPPSPAVGLEAGALVGEALRARPDLRAAELAMEAAGKRAGLARWEVFAISAVLDANAEGSRGFEAGPGLEVPIPLFHQNQGARARAGAEVERAARRYAAVAEAIGLEVREAHARLAQAHRELDNWREKVLPPLEETVRQAEKAYEAGDASLLLVLETARQLFEARRREVEIAAELRRAAAELERGVGRRLDPRPPIAGK
jgi:cobalt-zinc-cadmium efflux system outer membrane protein